MNPSVPGAIRHIRTLALSALLLALPFAIPAAAQAATPKINLASYADRLLTATYPADEPGAAVLIVHDGETVLRKGYGMANLELGVPIRPEMVFEIGSVTKQFTAAAILELAERGRLAIEDDIRKHLPDYPTHGRTITLEHLLTHTSGIPSYTALPEWQARVREDLTVEQLIGIFKDKPLEFEPGERYSYNNSAYALLGAVIEKLSGKTYEDFIEQEIFRPLGMNHSRYGSHREIVPGRVHGYDPFPEGYLNTKYLSFTSPYAAGSLLTNVDDLALWDRALATETLLRKTSLERMFTPVKLNSGASSNYGYGFTVYDYAGRRVIEHGGDIFGFTGFVLRIPEERLLVTILSNNPRKRTEETALKIAAAALGRPLEARTAVALDAQALDEYVGVYRFDAKTARAITREGSQLYSQRGGSDKQKIFASARDEFFFENSISRLKFRRDAGGKVVGVELRPRNGADQAGARTGEPLPAERKAAQVDPALYDAYAGTYELAPNFHIAITREGNGIFAQPTGQPKLEIFPESETAFFLKTVDARIVFVPSESGPAGELVLHQGGREMKARRVK